MIFGSDVETTVLDRIATSMPSSKPGHRLEHLSMRHLLTRHLGAVGVSDVGSECGAGQSRSLSEVGAVVSEVVA